MLKHVPEFLKTYTGVGNDMRAVHDFMECESTEAISSLKSELAAISQSVHTTEYLDKALGISRRLKHGSHEQWAKYMLQWIAAKKN